MAANLQAAGFPLVVHDVRREAACVLLDRGARWAKTPAEVGRTVSFGPAPRVFLIVPVVGAFLIDFPNAAAIMVFLNLAR